jgi:hypothetical protein
MRSASPAPPRPSPPSCRSPPRPGRAGVSAVRSKTCGKQYFSQLLSLFRPVWRKSSEISHSGPPHSHPSLSSHIFPVGDSAASSRQLGGIPRSVLMGRLTCVCSPSAACLPLGIYHTPYDGNSWCALMCFRGTFACAGRSGWVKAAGSHKSMPCVYMRLLRVTPLVSMTSHVDEACE